jgi:hypothetical protein
MWKGAGFGGDGSRWPGWSLGARLGRSPWRVSGLAHEPFNAFAADVDAFTPEDGVHAG